MNEDKIVDSLLSQITVLKILESICFTQRIGAQKRSGLNTYGHRAPLVQHSIWEYPNLTIATATAQDERTSNELKSPGWPE